VDDQLAPVVQRRDEVLPAPGHALDLATGRFGGGGELRRRVAPGLEHPAAADERLELTAHGLDLGKLEHAQEYASVTDPCGAEDPGSADELFPLVEHREDLVAGGVGDAKDAFGDADAREVLQLGRVGE